MALVGFGVSQCKKKSRGDAEKTDTNALQKVNFTDASGLLGTQIKEFGLRNSKIEFCSNSNDESGERLIPVFEYHVVEKAEMEVASKLLGYACLYSTQASKNSGPGKMTRAILFDGFGGKIGNISWNPSGKGDLEQYFTIHSRSSTSSQESQVAFVTLPKVGQSLFKDSFRESTELLESSQTSYEALWLGQQTETAPDLVTSSDNTFTFVKKITQLPRTETWTLAQRTDKKWQPPPQPAEGTGVAGTAESASAKWEEYFTEEWLSTNQPRAFASWGVKLNQSSWVPAHAALVALIPEFLKHKN